VAPLVLAVAGALALGIAVAILRGFGPRYRVGRLLAVAPSVTVAEALALARAGDQAYVRVDGRVDSETDFEDHHHQPLVFRRRTIRYRRPDGAWAAIGPSIEAVPFDVREGLDSIGVEAGELAEGLIVVPRVRRAPLAELAAALPEDADPAGEGRLTMEQVSSVEHATIVGVPRTTADGRIVMGSGLGRPLILTTLERDEAMRVLTGGATGRSRVVVICLAVGVLLLAGAAAWWLVDALFGGAVQVATAASPDPTIRPGSDTRSSGGGPGLVGDPLLAILGVLGIGIGSVLATIAFVRLTSKRDVGGPPAVGSRDRR
jgi:hypothetical protein